MGEVVIEKQLWQINNRVKGSPLSLPSKRNRKSTVKSMETPKISSAVSAIQRRAHSSTGALRGQHNALYKEDFSMSVIWLFENLVLFQ